MSPAYKKDCMRMDFTWFEKAKGSSDEYYRQFYELFVPLGYSQHWGKVTCGWPEYLKNQYPRWDEFLRVRQELDPKGIFLTKYWCDTLGIEEPVRVEEPVRGEE